MGASAAGRATEMKRFEDTEQLLTFHLESTDTSLNPDEVKLVGVYSYSGVTSY